MFENLKKMTKWQKFIIIFFFLIFLIGILTVKDYGMCHDEELQRDHSIVNLKYVNITFGIKNNLDIALNFKNYSSLGKYDYKYYGVAIQMPLVIIEQIFNFKLDISTVYYIRHIYMFLLFFVALIYFYKLLTKYIIKDKKMAFLGVLFLVLSPRIYGETFYNIKDSVFLSLFIINLYYAFTYLNKNSKKNLLLLCLSSAININCRVVGSIISLFVVLFNNYSKNKSISKKIKENIVFIVLTFIIYTIITPASWKSPYTFPLETIMFFFNYSDPISHAKIRCYYLGKLISSRNLPWHYLPVLIVVTTPLLYILSSIFGFIKNLFNLKNKKINKNILFCNLILTSMLLFVMIIRPTIYNGWRHFYFLYPLIIINSIIGVNYLLQIKKIKKIIIGTIVINSVCIISWMVINHPYQYEFYELIFSKYTVEKFESGVYYVTQTEAIDYILKNDNRKGISIYNNKLVCYDLLSIDKRSRFIDSYDKLKSDYIIDTNKYPDEKLKPDYKEIYYKKINGFRLYTIYKKIR